MRLIRFILIWLITVSLPFSNTAAAAMNHCAQSATPVSFTSSQATSSQAASFHATTSQHVSHASPHAAHALGQDQASSHDQLHDSPDHDDPVCSNCSQCPSNGSVLAGAIVPPNVNTKTAIVIKTAFADAVPQAFLEQPFRPPAFA